MIVWPAAAKSLDWSNNAARCFVVELNPSQSKRYGTPAWKRPPRKVIKSHISIRTRARIKRREEVFRKGANERKNRIIWSRGGGRLDAGNGVTCCDLNEVTATPAAKEAEETSIEEREDQAYDGACRAEWARIEEEARSSEESWRAEERNRASLAATLGNSQSEPGSKECHHVAEQVYQTEEPVSGTAGEDAPFTNIHVDEAERRADLLKLLDDARRIAGDSGEKERKRIEGRLGAQLQAEQAAEKNGHFAKKQRVRYYKRASNKWYDAVVVGVHLEDGLPYYTVRYDGDRESGTDPNRLERLPWNADASWQILKSKSK